MSFLKNRSIGTKLSVLSGVPLILLIFITGINYVSSSRVNKSFIYSYENYAAMAADLAIVRADMQANFKNILKTVTYEDKDYIKQVMAEYETRLRDISDLIAIYAATPMIEEEKRLFAKFQGLYDRLLKAQVEALRLGSENKTEEAHLYYRHDLEPLGLETNAAMRDLSELLMKTADQYQNESVAMSNSSTRMTTLIAVIAAIFTIVMSFLVSRMITKPLGNAKDSVVLFAAGDLMVDFRTKGKDAISQMCNELDKMVSALRGVVTSVQDASGHLSDSAQNFSSTAVETNASVEEFRSNVDEVTSNLVVLASTSEEINASVEEVAVGAQTTAQKGTDIARRVDDAMKAGDVGMNAVHSAVEGVGRVAASSAASATAITELGSRARQIQSFVSQIGSIADQTNLLALNAAIEAARAGDAGRGFAVVAEEVRKLAEDSNVAAKSIAELASTITSDLDRIVGYAQENTTDSNKAKDLSSDTETAIGNMLDYLREIANATQDLAAVAEEQAASSEEIAEAIQDMSAKINRTATAGENLRTGVADIATASGKVADGAESLSGLSDTLQNEIAFFKLDGEKTKKPGRLGTAAGR
ncbi:MAG: methyl-accepting chemotaxis protein [Synergistaceae bacterium]|jgi:methyl-accepting chemotaxis protein|nr:methyl-accepting chemotaxis protein [Synergistaceae bacterium]